MPNDDEKRNYIDIWSRVVETQMHFNEMQVKSRQLGLTFVTAALGVAIVLLSNGQDFSLSIPIYDFEIQLHVSVLLVLGAMLALNAVKQLDLNVYHRMLRGAVTFGEDFEASYMKEVFDLECGMTQAISHYSRHEDASVEIADSGKYRYRGKGSVTAHAKIKGFYRRTNCFLLVSAIVIFLLTNSTLVSTIIWGEIHQSDRLETASTKAES